MGGYSFKYWFGKFFFVLIRLNYVLILIILVLLVLVMLLIDFFLWKDDVVLRLGILFFILGFFIIERKGFFVVGIMSWLNFLCSGGYWGIIKSFVYFLDFLESFWFLYYS